MALSGGASGYQCTQLGWLHHSVRLLRAVKCIKEHRWTPKKCSFPPGSYAWRPCACACTPACVSACVRLLLRIIVFDFRVGKKKCYVQPPAWNDGAAAAAAAAATATTTTTTTSTRLIRKRINGSSRLRARNTENWRGFIRVLVFYKCWCCTGSSCFGGNEMRKNNK